MTVDLPGSKSIAARILVIEALARPQHAELRNMPDNDDIRNLRRAISQLLQGKRADVGESGTAWRFLTALAAAIPGVVTSVEGAPSLLRRPIWPLVDTLRQAGADIRYDPAHGDTAPLIHGRRLHGGIVTIRGDISSQFISALMLVAPTFSSPVEIRIIGSRHVSESYLRLTAWAMELCGVTPRFTGEGIMIPHGDYTLPDTVTVPADWSGAAFFFEALALLRDPGITITFPRLHPDAQGDSRCLELFAPLGIKASVHNDGTDICYAGCSQCVPVEYEMSECPDLVPPFAVAMALTGHPFRITGIGHLRFKESDRIAALAAELGKLGYAMTIGEDSLTCDGSCAAPAPSVVIDTHGDHRMAMSFAPASVVVPLAIRHPEVADKSFPGFFEAIRPLVGDRLTLL